MPKYLCMQRNLSAGSGSDEKPSPAQMQEMYAKFNGWKEKFKDNLVDMGGKLGDGKLVTEESAADGPFVEIKKLVGGYMILSAESLEEAIEAARAFPGLVRPGSGVEVIGDPYALTTDLVGTRRRDQRTQASPRTYRGLSARR